MIDAGIDELHPTIAHHLVNSLRWTDLRPVQREAIGAVRGGADTVLTAPAGAGKTDAALLPLLSRMATEGWGGLSVLYLSPVRTLLADIEPRLTTRTAWLGRRAALWHGDIAGSVRDRLAADPPDILATTPESIEAILISNRIDHRRFLAGLRVVIIDELLTFVDSDRGWHLRGLLARLGVIAGRRPQRIGLAAPVARPDKLLAWLSG